MNVLAFSLIVCAGSVLAGLVPHGAGRWGSHRSSSSPADRMYAAVSAIILAILLASISTGR
jgi:hypothetical protein